MISLEALITFFTASLLPGVAIIFQKSVVVFFLLKYIVTGYLVYLAWRAFRTSALRLQSGTGGEAKRRRLYSRGIIMNNTNPKSPYSFLAYLPQFADPSKDPLALQIMLRGSLFLLATISVFGSIFLLAGTPGQWLDRSDRTQKFLNRIAGTAFPGLALELAIAERQAFS